MTNLKIIGFFKSFSAPWSDFVV